MQAVAARSFDIGKTLDSSDDTARLMLITQYAGTKTAYVYNEGSNMALERNITLSDGPGDGRRSGTKVGYLSLNDQMPVLWIPPMSTTWL